MFANKLRNIVLRNLDIVRFAITVPMTQKQLMELQLLKKQNFLKVIFSMLFLLLSIISLNIKLLHVFCDEM